MITSITIDETIDKQYVFWEMDCDEYRYNFENIDTISRTRIKCIGCNNYTTYASRVDQYGSNLFHYDCMSCERVYAVCVGCEDITGETVELAELISHHNYEEVKEDGDNYKVVLLDDDCKIDTLDVYNNSEIVYTKPIYFYDNKIFGDLTGHDGGGSSTWKCKCSTSTVSDK